MNGNKQGKVEFTLHGDPEFTFHGESSVKKQPKMDQPSVNENKLGQVKFTFHDGA